MKAAGKILLWAPIGIIGAALLVQEFGSMAMRHDAMRYVKERLRNPETIQFQGVRIVSRADQNSRAVCGELGAKNAMGRVTSYQRFFVFAPRNANSTRFIHLALEQTWPGNFDAAWQINCRA